MNLEAFLNTLCNDKTLREDFYEPGQVPSVNEDIDAQHQRRRRRLRQFFLSYIPTLSTLKSTLHFGLSSETDVQVYIVPYAYANVPSKGSTFADPLLTILLSVRHHLTLPFPPDQLKR